MKTMNIICVVIALIIGGSVNPLFANDKYVSAMLKNIEVVYTAGSIEELQTAVNTFERIGAAEKTKWEPQYYAAFGYIMMANREKDGVKKDAYLDQASKAIEKAKAIVPEESEIVALEGFVHMIRVTVDPASRGPRFAGAAMQAYEKAISLNPENPRALALLAQMQYGTAQFFGSSTTEACGNAKKALEKFGTFKSENQLAPTWGKSMAEGMQGQCK
jgi:tetratricopeptide (TPR) repeat protein